LPLNEPVVVEFTPEKKGEFAFTCGMGMLKGQIIVQQVSAHNVERKTVRTRKAKLEGSES